MKLRICAFALLLIAATSLTAQVQIGSGGSVLIGANTTINGCGAGPGNCTITGNLNVSGTVAAGAITSTTPVPVSSGGTGANSQAGAFTNIVSPGGALSGPLSGPSINSTVYVDGVVHPNIASAIVALPASGGTVMTPPNYTETLTTLAIGSPTQVVTLLASTGTTITVTGNSGVTIASGSSMICLGSVGNASSVGGCNLVSAQVGSPVSLLTNLSHSTGQEFFLVQGWNINCNGHSPTNGCVDLDNLYVPSALRDDLIYGFASSVGLHIRSDAFSVGGLNVLSFDNVWVNGSGNTGAQPVVIDYTGTGQISAVSWFGGAIEHAGSGNNELYVNGSGNSDKMYNIAFFGTQFEGFSGNTTGEILVKDAANVAFYNPNFSYHTASANQPCIELSQTVSGQLRGITVENARCSASAGNPAVKNDVTGYATTSGNYIEPAYYYTQGPTNSVEPFTIDGPLNVNFGSVGTPVRLALWGGSPTANSTSTQSAFFQFTPTSSITILSIDVGFNVQAVGCTAVTVGVIDNGSYTAIGTISNSVASQVISTTPYVVAAGHTIKLAINSPGASCTTTYPTVSMMGQYKMTGMQ